MGHGVSEFALLNELPAYLLKQGILGPPASTMPFFLSGSHRHKDIVFFQEAIKKFFAVAKKVKKDYDGTDFG